MKAKGVRQGLAMALKGAGDMGSGQLRGKACEVKAMPRTPGRDRRSGGAWVRRGYLRRERHWAESHSVLLCPALESGDAQRLVEWDPDYQSP